jgi:trans-aconitate methyltransferase
MRTGLPKIRVRRISGFARRSRNANREAMAPSTSWNPDSYSKNARFVSDLGEPLVQLLDPQAEELILDLGCGDGALTEKLAAAGSVVVGVDASRAFVESARARGLTAMIMDGQQLALKRRFDAVFSNAALHWMKRPELVVQGVTDCLKHGGRFVGEFGGLGNVETIRAALHAGLRKRNLDPWSVDPWYYPSAEEYGGLLEQYGFAVAYIELIPRPTQLPGDIIPWLEVFAQPFTKSVTASEQARFLEEVRRALEPRLRKSDGNWYADYIRLRFKATRVR